MIIPDINTVSNQSTKQFYKPVVLSRLLSFVIDYFIFAPVISFSILMFFRQGFDLYKTFPQSEESQIIFFYLFFGFLILTTFLQAIFITVWGATPGQYALKLRINFENQDSPLFFQAWLRQLGFAVSFLAFGLPLLKVFIDVHGRCFYDKMTDARVVSLVPNLGRNYLQQKHFEQDRKFWSTSLTTLSLFFAILFAIVFWRGYQNILTSPLAYKKMFNRSKKTCQEFADLESTDRLRYKIAMNLVGTLSDECLNQEADFVLWRNFTEDKSLAYFAKFIAAPDNSGLDVDYLKESCKTDQNSEGCYWSQVFINRTFNQIDENPEYARSVLGQIVSYEMNTELDQKAKNKIIKKIYAQNKSKSIQKFVILESLSHKTTQSRQPASENQTSDDVDDIKEMIKGL